MFVEFDGRLISDREELYDQLTRQLNLPAYFGRNLDALFDLLTEVSEPTEIHFEHTVEMEASLGSYAMALRSTLLDAQHENKNLIINFY